MLLVYVQLFVTGLALGALYALVAVGLTIVFGLLKVINFAHAQFLMLGGFLGLFLHKAGVPYLLTVLVAPAIVGAASLLVERGIVRALTRSEFFQADTLLATLGLGLVLENGAALAWGAQPYYLASPFQGTVELGGIILPTQSVFTMVSAGVVLTLLHLFLVRTRLGKAVRATAQSREIAALVGIETERMFMLAFALGTGLAGLGGLLLGTLYSVSFVMGGNLVILSFIIVVLGGPGNIKGALIASLLIGIVEAMVGGLFNPRFQRLLVMLVFLLVLVFRPSGLFGNAELDA